MLRAPWIQHSLGHLAVAPETGISTRPAQDVDIRPPCRPTVRPANQRYPQPQFVFPMTPPSTAGFDALTPEKGGDTEDNTRFHDEGQWTPTPPAHPSLATSALDGTSDMRFFYQTRHRRAHSDSTLPGTSVARESEPGGFKIVITQPGDEPRPRTTENSDLKNPPLLEIAIPSWRIGTPRFSTLGTPFIRGSSYAPTEERSSNVSMLDRGSRRASRTGTMSTVTIRGPSAPTGGQATANQDSSRPAPPVFPQPLRATYISTHLVIEPDMFDALTFKPACDDRSIVRYSTSGGVTAATPPRLVAEITSPSFLDYELLSDFFLTFRMFLEPGELLRMLFARLRWALARSDEAGMVVRVRTFVALRHWILNYFMDDFVIDYELRVTFCNLLNDFVDELAQDARARKVQLKILSELKKCWRRVCGQYWDGPDFDASLAPDFPIVPGGIAGHRDPNLDPSIWITDDTGPPQIENVVLAPSRPEPTSFYVDVSRAGHIDSIIVGDRPSTPENPAAPEMNPTSPRSIVSMDIVSCSFPTKGLRYGHMNSQQGPAAHPVDSSAMSNNPDPVATTPRALVGKRVRPNHTHKRHPSISDSLREHSTATEKVLLKSAELLLALPLAGSLVRGNMFPPGQSFVEVLPPSTAGGPDRDTTLFQPPPPAAEPSKEKVDASAMSGQGMRKLLGSVRRALSTKGLGVSPTHGNFINISPIGPKGATVNRLPGTAIVPQARPQQNGIRPPVRIDVLGAEVAEDFKRAVREDAAVEAHKHNYSVAPAGRSRIPGELLEFSEAHMDTTFAFSDNLDARAQSDMGITAGSKSIVIVDDTLLPDEFTMTGALPVNSSMDGFHDSYMQNVADPTPPNTPPGRLLGGTPRRSSYILGQHVLRSSLSADPLPPFIPDMETLGMERPSQDSGRLSFGFLTNDRSRPPLSGVQGHFRNGSSRSLHSDRSLGHRRYASFTSGIVPQPTIRSFDATTYSEGSIDETSQVLVPQPLRVLRRRPGGDLRAVVNVNDLDPATLRRSRSVGSLTTYTDSVRSSYVRSPALDSSSFVDVASGDFSSPRGEVFSLGAVAERNPNLKRLSLFSTHSSKPIMRPSFEAEAQKLAQIPDDVDDDGGVESALLKLEGKYEKRAPARLSMSLPPANVDIVRPGYAETDGAERVVSLDEKREHRNVQVVEGPQSPSVIITATDLQASLLGVDLPQNGDVMSFLSEDSRASYSSIPLLDRGLTDDGRSKRTLTKEWTDRSILHGPEDSMESSNNPTPRDSQHPSYEFIEMTDSMVKIATGETFYDGGARASTEHSFLDVESDDDTDLSSELSLDAANPLDEDRTLSPSKIGIAVSTLPAHPLGGSPSYTPSPMQSSPTPPSPPITLIQALHMNPPDTVNVPTVLDHQVWEKPLPPTPDTTPTTAAVAPCAQYPLSPADPTGTKEALRNAPRLEIPDPMPPKADLPRSKYAVHLPFILAFDSDVLAQQFTLIEKDALNEIDWKELIDMRWKNAEQNGINSRSWVSFLRDTDARGVEVVIARFNIMVKWAISEIVLTQNMEERARCIIKFIHIAAHCRKYRNFATMSQITIALTSNEISRLGRTWAMVPPSDQRTMSDLQALISPTRNFYSLRAEMEGGGSPSFSITEVGCIPFVGIYTHDLLFNAQRPSEIASSPTTAPLVNFERCRTSASVVKTLLRLLEASALYTFQPIEGITERCLWMGALSDDEIRSLGEELE